MVTIRQEQKNDYRKTEEVVKEAFLKEEFSDETEHELVKRIRECDAFVPELSIVAVDEDIVGHVMLSKITIEQGGTSVESLALAPVSVARYSSEERNWWKTNHGCFRKSERTWIRISCSVRTSRVLSEIWF